MPRVDGSHEAYGVMVLDVAGARIADITGFSDARLLAAFGLPAILPAERR